jgi:rSAM/selenodomain-associated transferase 2
VTEIVSVIIPTLNEAGYIGPTIESVLRQDAIHEIILVDGGSGDETVQIASRHARVLRAGPGRSSQMNEGARAAAGDILLFLHADTHLPEGALSLVQRTLVNYEAGAFRLRFDTSTPLLRIYSFCTRLNLPSICFGDRALFVRKHVFEGIGGFPDLPLFEDLELARRLHRRGRFKFLDAFVTTSSRRFLEHGPFRQQLRNSYLWLHYMAGSDPHRLTHLYPYGN